MGAMPINFETQNITEAIFNEEASGVMRKVECTSFEAFDPFFAHDLN
jgi:hypothetical protein